MDRYEVMAGKMTPLTDGAHRKWGFAGKDIAELYRFSCIRHGWWLPLGVCR